MINPFDLLNDLLRQFIQVVPNIIGAFVVAFVGWLISRFARRVVERLLKATGIDKLAERLNEIDLVDKSKVRIVPSKILSSVLYYVLILFFFIAAAEVLQMEAVSNLVGGLIEYVPYLISAGIVLGVGLFLADFIKDTVVTACKSLGVPSANLIGIISFWFVFLTAAVSALSQAQIDTSFITSNLTVLFGGVVLAFALGYGFASKDMMADMLASFYNKQKVKVGDVVQIGSVKGIIKSIDRTSLIIATDKSSVVVPLSKLTTEEIEIFNK